MKRTKIVFVMLSLLLVCAIAGNLVGCSVRVQAADLMDGIEAGNVSGKVADDRFIDEQMCFAMELFKSAISASKKENVLISPLSIQLALTMAANGASGQTREEMERVLGGSEITIEELNEYFYAYVNNLPSSAQYKLKLANSIWFRDEEDRLTVEKSFLQTNADYYGAQAYGAPFDTQSVKDINNWVSLHTDGMIEKMIDEIDPDTVMYLINALVFDAEWDTVYEANDIYDGVFTAITGEKKTVDMMHSSESKYLDDGKATGFIKDYKDGKYSFVALLPNKNIDIYDYVASLTGEELQNTISNAALDTVSVTMPKFSYEYDLVMNDILYDLGMSDAFSFPSADFSRLGRSSGNIYISEVLHKTFISVDKLGTKAGAVTKVEFMDTYADLSTYEVQLDRPFVYMIIDSSTTLPIFMGCVTDIQK